MHFDYFKTYRSNLKKIIIPFFSNYLRAWDVTSSHRVDHFVTISRHVQKRIKKYYGCESTVIYPPVDCDFYHPSPSGEKEGEFFLMVTAFAPYKKVDVAIQAFNRLGKPLVIIGEGQELETLKKIAKRNIEFLGWQSNEKVRDYYRRCKAFIFPGEEDFGIAPVEAQACGKPVIAYGRGGILESVIPFPQENPTGIFFDEPTVDSLSNAIHLFESKIDQFNSNEIRKNVLRFHQTRFREEIRSFIEQKYLAFQASQHKGIYLAQEI
jgi:glycosyltransferase involved in cell wall biosynthesis